MGPSKSDRYILSAGRTGTVYLERLINKKLVGVCAKHEPADTRYLMMLANFRNDFCIGGRLLTKLFDRGHKQREDEFGPCYVEINPFLCAYTDVLSIADKVLRIVHVVRDPADWARSITAFKASTSFRSVIDYIPFAKPFPSPRPEGWRRLTSYEKALWRWNFCNSQIAALQDRCASFAVVRYEDIFSGDNSVRNCQFEEITKALDLPGTISASDEEIRSRENAFSAASMFSDSDAAHRICGDLARTYGYDY